MDMDLLYYYIRLIFSYKYSITDVYKKEYARNNEKYYEVSQSEERIAVH